MRIPKPVYNLRRHKRFIVALVLFLVPLMSLYSLKPLLAAPTYSITPSNGGRIQEGNTIVLNLTLTNGLPNQQYVFYINVTQPDASMHAAQLTVLTDPSGKAIGLKNYPNDFNLPSAGSTSEVGTYNIVVNQASPSIAPSVATGSFTVGLTDKAEYQRTNTVLIQASGYGNGESVTVDIAMGSTHATGFPMVVTASSTGIVSASWHIPVGANTGTWTASASGTSTVKAPVDQQTFSVNPAVLLVTVTTDQSIYARTQTITAFATVQYPDGTVLNGTYPNVFNSVQASFTNGSHIRTMSWNTTAQNWYATYTVSGGISPSNLPQTWIVQATASDTFGNTGSNQAPPITIRLVPASPDLEITAVNSTSNLAGVFLNVTFANGTIAAQGTTDANGNYLFTLPTAYQYWVVATLKGYNDYLDTPFGPFTLQGNLMHRTYRMSNVLYTGTVLSGSYTTLARYNPGDSGVLNLWIYNQNTTFPITITRIEVQFPWFANYGATAFGNVSALSASATIGPKQSSTWTVPFTIPNDGRLYSGSGGAIYFSATAPAWKTSWNITNTGEPVSYRTLDTAYINPYNTWAFGSYYASHGFVAYPRIIISAATQDTAAGFDLNIIEILMGALLVNVVLLVLIWMRLKPIGKMGALPKV